MNSFSRLRPRIDRSDSERGAILVLTALVMLLLLFVAAFATDLGAWYRQGSEQQRAADVGSLNGIAAYDRSVRVALGNAGDGSTSIGSLGDAAAAEEEAMMAAVEQIRALLETSGLEFDGDGIVSATFTAFPDNPDEFSEVILEATDGTRIIITRELVENGTDLDGDTIYTPVINVTISQEGDQFFSGLLRDAPTIDRTAQALLSNCGATCNTPIVFNPPFAGFDAPGNGDGYTPLLRDVDGDGKTDEIWAVNHHANPGEGVGSIICYEAESQDPCDDVGQYPLPYRTHRSPMEYLHTDGKLYFAGVTGGKSGLVCFDTNTRNYCSPTAFAGVWDNNNAETFPAYISANGPFFNDNRLYMVAQNGDFACFNLNMTPCMTAGIQDIVYTNDASFPPLEGDSTGHRIQNAEQLGETVVVTQDFEGGVIITCLDLSRDDGQVTKCSATSETLIDDGRLDYNGFNVTFTRYTTGGTPNGVCVYNIGEARNVCVDTNAQNPTEITNMNAFGALTGGFVGDAFTWQNDGQVRTFIGTGSLDYILCYDWTAGRTCNDGPDLGGKGLLADIDFLEDELGIDKEAGRQDQGIETYAFAQITPECVIALGDEAIFFSFNPIGFGACVDSEVTTEIAPCPCADPSAGASFGIIRIPSGLLADVTSIEATVTDLAGNVLLNADGAPIEDLRLDAGRTDGGEVGVLDLSELSGTGNIILTLRVDSKLDDDGKPLFSESYHTDLEIDISPTLSR